MGEGDARGAAGVSTGGDRMTPRDCTTRTVDAARAHAAQHAEPEPVYWDEIEEFCEPEENSYG